MRWAKLAIWPLLLTLSGCQLLDEYRTANSESSADVAEVDTSEEGRICLIDAQAKGVSEHNCDLIYWLTFWVEHNSRPWQERKQAIAELGQETEDVFRKVLLSQGKGTPYQARLRAQNWATELTPKLTPAMQDLLTVLVFQPSQELLEFESALVILTRVNADQSRELEAQQERIKEQQKQIEEFLKIEASMMEKREGIDL